MEYEAIEDIIYEIKSKIGWFEYNIKQSLDDHIITIVTNLHFLFKSDIEIIISTLNIHKYDLIAMYFNGYDGNGLIFEIDIMH